VGGIVILTEDITRFKQAEHRLQLAASVFHHASEAICVTDLEGRILEVNETFCRITGYAREEAVGQNPRILKSGFQTDRFYQETWQTIGESGRWRGEFWNRAKDGRLFAVMSTITTVFDASGKPQYYVALFADISSIKEQEQKLAQIARYDALTGLPIASTSLSVFVTRWPHSVKRVKNSWWLTLTSMHSSRLTKPAGGKRLTRSWWRWVHA
jgi:PAS domain S-box-containing protein